MAELPGEFRPALESYSGPLDLLLYLIKKDEIDIFDVPIARLIEQYGAYLEILKVVDPNSCGEFLVMAANLMEIKSKLLLPREQLVEDEELEDPRLELVQQLLEYKKYKERAMLLERRFAEYRRRHQRPAGAFAHVGEEEPAPFQVGSVSVWDLLTAFHRIQVALGRRGPVRFVLQERPVEEYIAMVEEALQQAPGRRASFDSLFAEAPSRQEAIGVLLAILEMAKDCRIGLSQETTFGPIEVHLHDDEEAERRRAVGRDESESLVDPAQSFLLEGEGREARLEPIAESDPGGSGEVGDVDSPA